jgi:hypothetical protein
MTKKQKHSPAPPIRCACGREELLTPAISQPANTEGEKQLVQDERPGLQSQETSVTAGPVKPQNKEN